MSHIRYKIYYADIFLLAESNLISVLAINIQNKLVDIWRSIFLVTLNISAYNNDVVIFSSLFFRLFFPLSLQKAAAKLDGGHMLVIVTAILDLSLVSEPTITSEQIHNSLKFLTFKWH